jgi:membrane fusion protein (multidrug efflux system)
MLDRVKQTPPLEAEKPLEKLMAARSRLTAQRLRKPLLIGGPALVVVAGLGFWFTGGRYVETDNAYVGADTVVVTPEITGTVSNVGVREGQHIAKGDLLFQIDAEPYRIARDTANGEVAAASIQLDALKESHAKAQRDIQTAQTQTDYQQKNYDRIAQLAQRNFSAQADLDKARAALNQAEGTLAAAQQTEREVLAQLGGDTNLALEKYPPFMQAKAKLDEAERDMRLTELRAPISGVVTQSSSLLPGRYLAPGTAALAVVDVDHVWVDANPKETDLEKLKAGEPAEVTVDAYPGHVFTGTLDSISPGTGAQFALLPAQNASGNWVKVVQRIPVRIRIDRQPNDPVLRAGMSANVSIDTRS